MLFFSLICAHVCDGACIGICVRVCVYVCACSCIAALRRASPSLPFTPWCRIAEASEGGDEALPPPPPPTHTQAGEQQQQHVGSTVRVRSPRGSAEFLSLLFFVRISASTLSCILYNVLNSFCFLHCNHCVCVGVRVCGRVRVGVWLTDPPPHPSLPPQRQSLRCAAPPLFRFTSVSETLAARAARTAHTAQRTPPPPHIPPSPSSP